MATPLEIAEKRRWERKRKLLPDLKLRYPNDSELKELARLAKVQNLARFGQQIQHIILDAHLNDRSFKNLSIPGVRNTLKNIASGAQCLEATLRAVDVGGKGSAALSGLLLESELLKTETTDRTFQLPEYMGFLQKLADAAERGASSLKSKRGPKAAAGVSAFELFAEDLLIAAWQQRGDWTVYRSADTTWVGTFLQALVILQKYLPEGFFPDEGAGRPVEYIRTKLKKHIAKNPGWRR
jgi:hypothetical protein